MKKSVVALGAAGAAMSPLLYAVGKTLATPQKVSAYTPDPDPERAMLYAQKLSKMIQYETVSVPGELLREKFLGFHKVLEELFPLVHENLEKTEGSSRVSIALSTTTDGGITISGMFPNSLEATLVSDEDGDYFQIAAGQVAGTSSYGDYVLNGLFFYEGDEESAGGWYFSDIYGYIQEDGTISIQPWLARVLTGGQYDGYNLTPYWVEGSTLTPADPLSVVVAPEGLETEEYSVTARNYKDDSDVSGSVYIGFDGSDVYIQGLSTYLPDAWVKGTLDGTTITFPYGQYLGNYGGSYDMYLNTLVSADVVFNYDAEEVVQAYVSRIHSAVQRPQKELKGFAKVALQPGESKEVSFTLDKRSFAYWNAQIHDWHVETGVFTIEVGASSRDLPLKAEVRVESTVELPRRYTRDSIFMDSKIKQRQMNTTM